MELLSNPGTSKWVTTNASPGLIRQETRNRYRQQLNGDAAALLPDADAIAKQLLAYDVPYADIAPLEQTVSSMLGDYMDEYRKNPYYAFQRKARDTKKTIQAIVTDPRLKQLEGDYANAKKAYENVRYDLGSNLNYQDGTMSVIDRQTKQRVRIPVNNFDPQRYSPLTVDGENEWMTRFEGLARRQDPFAFNMSKPKDVRANIQSHFQSMGADEYDQLIDMLGKPIDEGGTDTGVMKRSVHSKNRQINARLDSLVKYGLSQADINTLKSEFFTKNFQQTGQLGTEEDAKSSVLDYVKHIAEGYEDEKTSLSKSPKLEGALGAAELKGKEKEDVFMATLNNQFPSTKVGSVGITKDYKGQLMDMEMRKVPISALEKSSGSYKMNDEGQSFPRMNASEMHVMKYLGSTPMMINANTGQAQQVNGFQDIANEAVLDPRQDVGLVTLYHSGSTGKTLTLEEIKQLTTESERTGVIPAALKDATPKLYLSGTFIMPSLPDDVDSQMNEAGYKRTDLSGDEQNMYENNVNSTLPQQGGRMWSTGDHYKVRLMFEATPEALRMASGEDIKIETSHAHATSMTVKDKSLEDFIIPEDVRQRNLQKGGYRGLSALK